MTSCCRRRRRRARITPPPTLGSAALCRLAAAAVAAAVAAAAACGGGPRTVEVPAPTPAAAAAIPETTVMRPALAPWRAAANVRLLTRWAADVRPEAVLPEYPRPQMVRPRWQSLNGLWEFALVDSSSVPGVAGDPHRLAHPSRPGGEGPAGPLPMPSAEAFVHEGPAGAQRILVPFAPEAALSGVGRHADRVAYRRNFRADAGPGPAGRWLLHFGACDWHCTIFVNGRMVADHTGGYDAFTVDVTDALLPGAGDNELALSVYDPTDKFGQPRGKQVSNAEGIWYTPVTGIWQTVWLEPVPVASIARLHMTPDLPGSALRLTVVGRGTAAGQRVEAVASSSGREVGRAEGDVGAELRIPVPDARLWSPDDPFLYDLRVVLRDPSTGSGQAGAEVDRVDSYFGMRSVSLAKDANGFDRIALNGRPVFQLGPLDQGWWPDGLYTAPTDAALRSDIEAMKALGFNMVRKHIKVEPARWYYHADRLGLAVWQDMPSGWNDSPEAQRHFERELRAMLEDLHSVPSIVVWVPFNEKWGQFDTRRIVGVIEAADSSRLVNDVSGWQHEGAGDIIDVHRYQGPQAMRGEGGRVAVVGEFGGLGYKEGGHAWAGDAWGYGGLFPTREALAERYDLLVRRLLRDRDTHGVGAGVYTQLTDVEVELNGFLTYDRAVLKFDTARVAAVNRGLAPYVLPELAEFVDTVRVSIVTGAPDAEVRYTTDGSEPTASSPAYRRPFTLRRDATVRARSFAGGRPTAAPEARVAYRRAPGRAPAAVASRALEPGLAYALYRDTTAEPAYRMHWPVRWQLERPEVRPDDVAPSKTGVVAVPTLQPADTTELFGMRFTGYVRVPRGGVYTFTALSDDGAAMWVGDRNVFWSVGQSPKTTETWGQVALQAGLHPITLTYFQAYGPMALELYVEGPGLRRQRVPAGMLFRDRAPPPGAAAAIPASR
ncbi:MAG TPA: chitobiase/beta-hexosaminidase C-terminal domain-containing protein [Gemmatimonadaceae bacterium]|nr:chitobiase/beta-hexosaminidase C-terminal domain-containing protein [Gemmatimonadaceae bacterium]